MSVVITTMLSDSVNAFYYSLLRLVGRLKKTKRELYISLYISSLSVFFFFIKILFQFPATSSTRQFLAITQTLAFTRRYFNSP